MKKQKILTIILLFWHMEKMSKKIFILPIIFVFTLLMFLPLTAATSYTFGVTTHASAPYHQDPAANVAAALSFTPLSATDNYLTLLSFHTYINPTGDGGVKAVIWNAASPYNVLKISDQEMFGTEGWYFFTFDNYLLQNNTAYRIGIIGSAQVQIWYDSDTPSQVPWVTANSYASPTTLTPGANAFMSGYILCNTATDPTPTPSPSPSPTPFTYQGDIWAALSPYANILLPLVLIIFIALLCGKYGGVWGFFAGLNVSAILVYAIMGAAYMPLWGLVLLALVDGLLLFGKISGRI